MIKSFQIRLYLLLIVLPFLCYCQKKNVDSRSVVNYLLEHQKKNGAFGPDNKEYTDLAWNYPAVNALMLLGSDIPREKECFENGNKSWMELNPWKNGPWYWSFYQKANLYQLFKNKDNDFEEGIQRGQEWNILYKPRKGYLELREYQNGFFFDIPSLSYLINGIKLVDGKVLNKVYVADYLKTRQSDNGAFVDDINENPTPTDPETNLIITYYAIMTLHDLGIEISNKAQCIKWLQSCQTAKGGFKYSPNNSEPSNEADVWYTWAAIKALNALDTKPKQEELCIKWLNSLQNYDGGFGDRPGWKSRIYSTYYSIESLSLLTGNAGAAITKKARVQKTQVIPEGKYSIYQAHQKSPSGGTGMIDSIVAMKLNLIGVKSKERDVNLDKGISPLVLKDREYAIHKKYPLEVLEFPENYSHNLIWDNGQKADHVSDFLIPPNLSEEEGQTYKKAFLAGQKGLTWNDFKKEVIHPIKNLKGGTLFYPELDYTMLNAYKVYDDGLEEGDGYNAVPGAHFGNIDWVRHFPYKERWEGILPIIADGDAHANIVKWRKNLMQYRNIYIAKNYNFKNYIDSSKNNRSVCVIHMPSGEVRYYGNVTAINYLKKHKKEWQWWDENNTSAKN